MVSKASAPGKLILFGEHAVVYGVPSIVCAIGKRIFATVEPAKKSSLEFDSISISSPLDGELELLKFFKRGVGLIGKEAKIRIDSQIPIGAGLGSSAAMACSFLKAASAEFGLNLGTAQIAEYALEMEKIVHGTPSGVDPAVSANGGFIEFQKGVITPLKPTNLPLIIGYTGKERSTKQTVSHVAELHREKPEMTGKIFSQIHEIVRKAKAEIQQASPDLGKIGKLMTRNHELLQKLEVSSAELDKLVGAALEAGAHGAKLTGAGGGGCMVALGGPEVSEAIKNSGGIVIESGISKEGVRDERLS
ncbi:MAG: mevalonate kinase [archaeon]